MGFNAGNPEGIADSTDSDHENIEGNLKLLLCPYTNAGYRFGLRQYIDCLRVIECNPSSCIPNRFNDTAKLDCTNRGAWKKRGEKKVVPWTDDCNIIVIRNSFHNIECTEAGAKDHEARTSDNHRCRFKESTAASPRR